MKSYIFNKTKVAIAVIFGFIFVTTMYIALSTVFISKDVYRKVAWDYINHENSITNWKNGSVEKVKLSSDRFLINPNRHSRNINRISLNLNGNHAVRVTFNTEFDALLGPTVVYINPFTKQVIGIDARD